MQDASYRTKRQVIPKVFAVFLILGALCLLASVVLAQGGYDLSWRVIAGGGGQMQSAGYTLIGTIGQPSAGTMTGSSSALCSGFWCGHLYYGVTLDPATDAESGAPGEMVTYTLRITNTGNTTDIFDLAYAGTGIHLPVTQTTLASGAGADVIANVTIPAAATNGTIYTAIVTATSQGDPIQSDTSALATTAVVSCIPVITADLNFTPTAPRVGEIVTFTASFSPTSATPPITYTWDWGDGSADSSGQPVTHTFPSTITAKTYTVTLTVDNICVDPAVTAQKPATIHPRTLYLPLTLKNYASQTLIFADDFSNGTLTGWTSSGGTWTNPGGYMQGVYLSDTVWNMKAISGTDVVYQGKVNLLSGNAVGLVFRSSANGASSYAVILDTVQGFKISDQLRQPNVQRIPLLLLAQRVHYRVVSAVLDQ